VPPYGLERVRAGAEAAGAEVEILDPYLLSATPVEAAAETATRTRPDVVGLGLRVVEDCIVVDRLDGDEASPYDLTWFMPEIRRLRDALATAAPDALFVLGGAAFSAMPGECLDYLDVDYGIVGAGESAFPELLRRVADGRALDGVAGLVGRGDPDPLAAYGFALGGAVRREPLYAPVNSIPVRTRAGCAMACAYCLTANMRRRYGAGDLGEVLEELETAVRQALERGVSRVPVFFADDELNLPSERHTVAVLRGIEERGLSEHIRWRAYLNPTPFSDELAELVRATNGHVSVTVDTAAEPVMARAGKPFRRRHLDALVDTLARHAIPADLNLIFGLPGETEETLAETVSFVRSLPPEIEVAYSTGARVYPHTPLATIAREEPEHVHGNDPAFFEPTFYAAPLPPRALARHLAGELDGLANVRRVGVGFGSARTTMSDGYRAVTNGGGRRGWKAVLEEAERLGDYERTPGESLSALAQLAIWHGRFDYAARAFGRLARQRRLPEGVTRRSVWLARAGCAALALAGRVRRA
jgi:anaerobic magnesium-protoporphyrin IX monomethyl ester cyclase